MLISQKLVRITFMEIDLKSKESDRVLWPHPARLLTLRARSPVSHVRRQLNDDRSLLAWLAHTLAAMSKALISNIKLISSDAICKSPARPAE